MILRPDIPCDATTERVYQLDGTAVGLSAPVLGCLAITRSPLPDPHSGQAIRLELREVTEAGVATGVRVPPHTITLLDVHVAEGTIDPLVAVAQATDALCAKLLRVKVAHASWAAFPVAATTPPTGA